VRRNCVGIEIASDRIDVVLIRGRDIAAVHRIAIAAATESGAWNAAVRGARAQLRSFVEQNKAQGLPATVLYRNPSQVVDFPYVEVKSAQEACSAASLSCSAAIPPTAGAVVCDAAVIANASSGSRRRWHVVVAADRDDAIDAIESVVVESGLKFVGALPIDVAIVLAMVDRAARHRQSPSHGWLHLGMHSSIFLARIDGAIRFLRRINVGLETVAASLARPIHQHGSPEPVHLAMDAARRMLFESGIPLRDQLVHEQLRLHGSDTLPLMQPVLQRLLVELRQSLRFGLEEQERAGLRVTIEGPGCTLPRFVDLVGTELQVQPEVDAVERGDSNPFQPGFPGGELVQSLSDSRAMARFKLFPAQATARQQNRRSRRCLWAGAAVAAALLAGEWVIATRQLSAARQQMQGLESQTRQVESVRAARDQVVQGTAALAQLKQVIDTEVGSQADLRAVLVELALITPQTIRLTSIELTRESGVLIGSVVGYLMQPAGEADRNDLEQFMNALKQSPLLKEVVLRDVRSTKLGDEDVLRFSASFRPVTLPTNHNRAFVVDALEETAP
jgi:Tfp pilus assembly PilM family ATPase/Tfp pilus assembly protein PilN